jgi:hypothetical protein
MRDIEKLVKKLVVVCVGLVAIGFSVVAPSEGGDTKVVIKSKASGSFVTTLFDFDHPDLSTPAAYFNAAGIGSAGAFTSQALDESAPDGKTCTVPGGVVGAGTEFTLVGGASVSRTTATGDLLFTKTTSGTECDDLSTFPTPPFPFVGTDTGIVTGGTGKYSGATGTYTLKFKGAFLALPATGLGAFGWSEAKTVTTLTLP